MAIYRFQAVDSQEEGGYIDCNLGAYVLMDSNPLSQVVVSEAYIKRIFCPIVQASTCALDTII